MATNPLSFTSFDDYGKPPITNYGMMEKTPIIIGLWHSSKVPHITFQAKKLLIFLGHPTKEISLNERVATSSQTIQMGR